MTSYKTNEARDLSSVGKVTDISASEGKFSKLVRSLRRRKVFRAAMTYAVITWVILQIADVAFPIFGVPERALRVLVRAMILGFPITVVIAWIFQITPRGIIVDNSNGANSTNERRSELTVNLSLLLIASLLVLCLVFVVDASGSGRKSHIVINATDIHRPGIAQTPIAGGIADELYRELADTMGIEPVVHNPGDRDHLDSSEFVLWINVYAEANSVNVVVLLLDPRESGSYPYVDSFEVPANSIIDAQSKAAKRIAEELHEVLPFASGNSAWSRLLAQVERAWVLDKSKDGRWGDSSN